ncbi:hypothetical protein F5Y15DRAFT_387563 [Xylariaceae sp. FL0016]|nr:hypothetical protein F5Y15DRAFT_387563 [Xylariaceae sp. FL0016]
MNPATPRMRFGGYPETPAATARRPQASPTRDVRPRSSLRPAPENVTADLPANPPLIPLNIIDAPTQRFYAVAIWVALIAWRLYDWLQVQDDGRSAYFFCKWLVVDFVYLFGLPSLRIPWLELSSEFVIVAFFIQTFVTWCLMFDVPLPGHAWLLGILKMFFHDKELAISEHNIKVSNILHNQTRFLGKQIINILPEGSALLNPEKNPYCVGKGRNTVTVPLYFNATVPVEIELVRYDLDTDAQEILKLGRKDMKEIAKQAAKCDDDGSPGTYQYDLTLKKPGAYSLNKVLDEHKLEVQKSTQPTYVVPCPKAMVRAAESATRCLGELSDLSLDVVGTPPLRIVYSRTVNGKDRSFHFQSLQPDGFSSPLLGTGSSMELTSQDGNTWARSQQVVVSLNESMNNAGNWQYSVDEVHDAFGNVVSYQPSDDVDTRPKSKGLFQDFIVRERPRAQIKGCDSQNPLKVAKGGSIKLPVEIGRPGKTPDRTAHTITWRFSPIDTLTKNGDHGDIVEVGSFTAKHDKDQPTISAPGLYSLDSVTCESCEGEIEEPSSCLLLNPLEPSLAITSEEIPDKCAGKSIGLRVNLDLVGTPPFNVHWDVRGPDGRTRHEMVKVDGLRQQIELLPRSAGRHSYTFRKLEDSIYKVPLPLSEEYRLEQNVKPPATAFFLNGVDNINACLDQPVNFDVKLDGDGPFNLEWEIVHDGKRKSAQAKDISEDIFTIETAPLASGGDYTLALKSIQDKTGCRIFLRQEVKISVPRQKPRVSFGELDGKRITTVVEAAPVDIPLRLSGEGPWKVSYRINGNSNPQTRVARNANDIIQATDHGVYEILDVMDKACPGAVNPKANTFEVKWFQRPELSLVPSKAIGTGDRDHKFVKDDICEGDVDGFEVALQGSPPYHVEYEVRHKPSTGSGSVARKSFDAVLGKASIQMDTAKAGLYSYTFSALSDNLYNNQQKRSMPLVLEQTVHAKPAASFAKPGQTFKSCLSEHNRQKVPIRLQGKAPFYLELEIKHNAASGAEVFTIPPIESNSFDIEIPMEKLKIGAQSIRIKKVRDARGCQSEASIGGPMVHFHLYDSPSIYPIELRTEYCAGERLSYTLSGTPPFEIHYDFAGKHMKAKSQSTTFRRIAEFPGDFTITGVSDKASECRAAVNIPRTIHELPDVKVSRGRVVTTDIHEGSEVEILFEFGGTPPFEFSYTRSTNAKKGQKSQVLETRHDISYEHSKVVRANLEGTYEVVAIKDAWCSINNGNVESTYTGPPQQKLLQQ